MRFINGTRLDDRIIRTDWDAGFKEGRQYGRGKSGGQVRMYLMNSHPVTTLVGTPVNLLKYSKPELLKRACLVRTTLLLLVTELTLFFI